MTFLSIFTILLGTLLIVSAIEKKSIVDTMKKWIIGTS